MDFLYCIWMGMGWGFDYYQKEGPFDKDALYSFKSMLRSDHDSFGQFYTEI